MANSLISPITIDGTAYCNTCEGGRSTKGVLTEDILFQSFPEIQTAVITNDCSPWQIMTGSISSFQFYEPEGEMSFGVSCGTTVTVDLAASATGGDDDDAYSIDVDIYRNGALWNTYNLFSTTGANTSETDIEIAVTGGPCGEIITIYAQSILFIQADPTTTATLIAEVTSIT